MKPEQVTTLATVIVSRNPLDRTILVERGALSFTDKVSQHVPGFEANGKGDITRQYARRLDEFSQRLAELAGEVRETANAVELFRRQNGLRLEVYDLAGDRVRLTLVSPRADSPLASPACATSRDGYAFCTAATASRSATWCSS